MLRGKREEHPTEFMDGMGTRLAFVEETEEGHRLDTVRLKRDRGDQRAADATGHGGVRAVSHPGGDDQPPARRDDTDHGTWRPLLVIPFAKSYGQDGLNADTGLRARVAGTLVAASPP